MAIRRAIMREHELLEALMFRASTENSPYRDALIEHPEAVVVPLSQIHDGRVYVFERGGNTLGFMAILATDAEGAAELDGLFVEPSEQGRGIGRALVMAAKQLAADEDATRLEVIASPEAEGFYLACGFIAQLETQTRFGRAIRMSAAISRLTPPGAAPAPRSRRAPGA